MSVPRSATSASWLDPVQRVKVAIEVAAIVVLTRPEHPRREGVGADDPADLRRLRRHPRHRSCSVTIFGNIGRRRARVAAKTTVNYRHDRGVARRRWARSLLFVRAYSLGGGTYTGIEAVSNGVQIMREPKVRTAKRTMVLMATSLAHHRRRHHPLLPARPRDARRGEDDERGPPRPRRGRRGTSAIGRSGSGSAHGPLQRSGARSSSRRRRASSTGRASWRTWRSTRGCPHRFSALSERLSMQNGVLLMGGDVGRGAALHARRRLEARRHVLDQRVSHVLALEPRHEPLLDHSTGRSTRTGYRHLPVHLVGARRSA